MERDVNHSGSNEMDQRIREMSVWRLSRLRALAPPSLDSDDGADLVVACLLSELDSPRASLPSGMAGIVADSCWASRPVPDSNRLKKAADCSRGDERHPGARNSAVNLGASRR